MSFFYVILLSIPVLNLAFWWWADRRLRSLPAGRARRWLRVALALFVAFQLGYFAWIVAGRSMDWRVQLPAVVPAMGFLWSLLVLPLTMIFVVMDVLIGAAVALTYRLRRRGAASDRSIESNHDREMEARASMSHVPVLTRRQVLAAGLAMSPPLLTGVGVGRGLSQLSELRVRRFVLDYPDLPPPLDGLTLAHLADTHVGRYTNGKQLHRIADAVNQLRPDIVFQTGDLIDAHLDDAPAALDMIRRIDAPLGVYMCEGNHDLFEGRDGYYSHVRDAGVPLLLNEGRSVSVRGVEMRVLGMMWGGSPKGRGANLEENFAAVSRHRNHEAFEVLLAHHPHAFDLAAEAGIPLTLAGHTHGGQLMLTPEFGAGPAMFRYWSGLYLRDNARLVVTNGAGNWFPLRLNAPAEIIHVTLRRA